MMRWCAKEITLHQALGSTVFNVYWDQDAVIPVRKKIFCLYMWIIAMGTTSI